MINKILKRFKYNKKPVKTIISQIDISQIVTEEVFIKILEPNAVNGNILPLELIFINQLIKFFNPENIFEIGTFDGRTTLNMAANSLEGSKIFTLDLPGDKINNTKLPIAEGDVAHIDKDVSGKRFLKSNYSNKIKQLYGDSATFNFSPYLNKIDFVFVDGSHSSEYVLNDSEIAMKLLKNNQGIILWHDYGMDSVTKSLNKLYLEDEKFKDLQHLRDTSLVYLIK